MSVTVDHPFYVYVLRRPCGAPFYVGMGQGIRVHMHERVARSADRPQQHIVATTLENML